VHVDLTAGEPPPSTPAVLVTRGGVVESSHLAHVVVARPDGTVTTIVGDPSIEVYPRSALKPLQALAVRAQLMDTGRCPTSSQLAIACASHEGGDDHQVEVAALLAEAGLDESALRCPADWPIDDDVRGKLTGRTTLSHNCSGKHAAFLWAHTAAGEDPATYLDPDAPLQKRIAARLEEALGERPAGPAVDGCGAPAWRCSLAALGRAFARLSEGGGGMAPVRDAMVHHPELVGGRGLPDTQMMWTDLRVVAKRGAEGVMAAGFAHPTHGPLGVAVKVVDGGDRAAGPLAGTVLHALGADIVESVRRPPVLGGGRVQGRLSPVPAVATATTQAFGLS
jgi:L-asparaginase II